MRTVVETAMVAHLWAHQSQGEARNQGGNFYFIGPRIYSYGSHFKCAEVVTNQKGETGYLVTDSSYSNTTAKHMDIVRMAIPSRSSCFTIHDFEFVTLTKEGKLNEHNYSLCISFILKKLEHIDRLIDAQKRSRSRDMKIEVTNAIGNIFCWINYWGLDKRQKSQEGKWLPSAIDKLTSKRSVSKNYEVTTTKYSSYGYFGEVVRKDVSNLRPLFCLIIDKVYNNDSACAGIAQIFCDWSGNPNLWKEFEARNEKHEASLKKARTTRERNEAIKWAKYEEERKEMRRISQMSIEEKIEKWRNGELNIALLGYYSTIDDTTNAILRIHNGEIQTSKGIRISIEEAKRLWPIVQRFHENNVNFQHDLVLDKNGSRWKINSYQNDILTAGCHIISYAEMENCARKLGLIEESKAA